MNRGQIYILIIFLSGICFFSGEVTFAQTISKHIEEARTLIAENWDRAISELERLSIRRLSEEEKLKRHKYLGIAYIVKSLEEGKRGLQNKALEEFMEALKLDSKFSLNSDYVPPQVFASFEKAVQKFEEDKKRIAGKIESILKNGWEELRAGRYKGAQNKADKVLNGLDLENDEAKKLKKSAQQFAQATEYFESRNYKEAYLQFKKFLREHSRNPKAKEYCKKSSENLIKEVKRLFSREEYEKVITFLKDIEIEGGKRCLQNSYYNLSLQCLKPYLDKKKIDRDVLSRALKYIEGAVKVDSSDKGVNKLKEYIETVKSFPGWWEAQRIIIKDLKEEKIE